MEKILTIGIALLIIALWFYAIFDIARSRFISPTMNLVWLIIVLIFPILGSIFYFLLRKKYVFNEPRKFQPNFTKHNHQ